MKELLIQLALEGYRVTFTNGGFSLRDSIEIRMSKVDPTEGDVVHNCCKILNSRDFDNIENLIRDSREEIQEMIRRHL